MPLPKTASYLASRFRPRSRRQYIATAVVVALILGGVGYLSFGRASGVQSTSITATIATGTFKQTVSGTGTIQPASQADLDFAVSGRVTSVKVKAGDSVKKGAVLATLDTVSLDAALASANAQLEAAQTSAANDGSDSSTQQASNNASVASAQADVAQAEDNLAAAELRSSIAGTVASVDVAVGDQVSGSSGSNSNSGSNAGSNAGLGGTSNASTSSSAITVVSPKNFLVAVDVAADEISKVKDGLQVEITPNGATAAIFGTVSDVGLVAETSSSGTATFPVTVKVTGEQTGLYAGTSADVSIIVKQVEDVLTVPSLALTTTGTKTYVDKVVGSSTQRTEVKVGTTYGASTEITSGLKVGDKVQITSVQIPRNAGGTGTRTGNGSGGFPGGGTFPGGGAGGFPGGNGGGGR